MKVTPNKDYIVDASAAADKTGPIIETSQAFGVSFIVEIDGANSLVGVLYLQGSNGDGDETTDEDLWADITSKNVSGNNTYFIEKADWLYKKARLYYDYTSGSGGTLNVQSLVKGV